MEARIGQILRLGMLVAAVLLILGLGLFFLRGITEGAPSLPELLRPGAPEGLPALVHGLLRADPLAVLRMGVLVLILTPMVRVAVTLVLFVAEGDWIFVVLTAIVFGILLLGFLSGGA